jgi:hypothetical protein
MFRTSESFFESIDKMVIYKDTVLVLDDCGDDLKYLKYLDNKSRHMKFRNIIVTASKILSTFYHIDADIIFCLYDTISHWFYNKHISKTIPLNIFDDILVECTRDDNVLMLDKKSGNHIIKKCIYEKQNTYIESYYDNFSYYKNVNALYHIYHSFSMYHDVNSKLYSGLWDNVNFIVKCSYLFFMFDILRKDLHACLYLPRELQTIILHFMIQMYQQNDIKDLYHKKKRRLITDKNTDYVYQYFINSG